MLHWLGFLRADSLEEIVGLDVGYTGAGVLKNRRPSIPEEDDKMDEYMKEYEHRKSERIYFAKAKVDSRKGLLAPIPASSIHNRSLHGNSYHGRKVITQTMIDSPDASRSSSANSTKNNGSVHCMDASSGSAASARDTNKRNSI
ncbi:hypothetical protein ACHAW5_003984 [Stephanodiscus triporus]|uniref:Uncharacterized protein n=1 Tax=Stephanodiscus triporus TaxID=2934178 RepID=A0ABD3QQV9_9STRA